MRPNGLEKGSLSSTPQRRSRVVFDRMSRYLGRLAKNAESGDVHRFRTNGRRVEALVEELVADSRNKNKLLKLLSKLRKKAGKLRDLDVQIAFLENLKIPDRQNHLAQFREWVTSERARRSHKLPKNFDAETLRELRKRLRRARAEIRLQGTDPLKLAVGRLPKPSGIELNEKVLHAFRIAAKRARYLAELSDSVEAKTFVTVLKNAQDVIGQWHDVLKLKEKAEQHFGGVNESPLVAALQNISRARFRRARNALLGALTNISAQYRVPFAEPSLRKQPDTDTAVQAAVA